MQIYSTAKGPAILVGHEQHLSDELEYHFVYARNGVVMHRWEKELPAEFELVYDPDSRAEADFCKVEANALIHEKEVLLDCLQAALKMLDNKRADEVRDIYRERTRVMPLISMTKGA